MAARVTEANGKKYIYKPPPEKYKRKPIKFMEMPKLRPHKVWTWTVMVTAMSVIIFFLVNSTKEKTFARHKEKIALRTQYFDCSAAYLAEVESYPRCVPKQCGRFVMDSLLDDREIDMLLELANAGFSLGGGAGGASILDLHSGALSRGEAFVNVYKLANKQLLDLPEHFAVYQEVQARIAKAISERFNVDLSSIHLTYPTFFSRITNAPAKTAHDEYWHPHIDKDTYNAENTSFHYTSLLYLNGYKKDFTGGRFVFIDGPNNKTLAMVEPKRGRVSVFTSGAENLHHVEPVGSGTRFAITISFTCDEKYAIKALGNTAQPKVE